MFIKPLAQSNVEQHIADIGLAAEYSTYFRMGPFSGGNQPHIFDREFLGALSSAIKVIEGDCVMITPNNKTHGKEGARETA
jgi:hypothetical protein